MDANLTSGCLPCFCYGHSAECKSSNNHIKSLITSELRKSDFNEWTAVDIFGKNVYVGLEDEQDSNSGIFLYSKSKDVWFNAPSIYLGNQLASYNQEIRLSLKFLLSQSSANHKDVILENSNYGLQAYRHLYDPLEFSQNRLNNMDQITQDFKLRLKESEGWRPNLSPKDFQRLLSNLTSIRIKATLGDYTVLTNFELDSAKKLAKIPEYETPASWIEECSCPKSHSGQFCENCAFGFRREFAYGDSFVKCVPCSCNNHSLTCDPSSGLKI